MASAAETTWSIAALLQWTERFFSEKKLDSPRLDAQILLAHALNCRRTDLYVRHDDIPTEEQRSRFRELVRKRAAGVPVAYLVGTKEFFLLSFDVTPDVLIPRPATETLVMTALDRMKGQAAPRVLDVGTGSGCIAISIASRMPQAKVTAVDVSPKALAIARRNAEKLQVAQRIRFLESDLFAAIPAGETFDLILSNPPYIRTPVLVQLDIGVRDHEPRLALDGGPSGFLIIDRIMADAKRFLAPNGRLLLEIGFDQSEQLKTKADNTGWTLEKIVEDNNRTPRVAVLSVKQ